MFGVTPAEVVSLAPHISVSAEPAGSGDLVFGGSTQKVRTEDVQRWIDQVSSLVDVALSRRSLLDTAKQATVESAAKTVIINGAAAYLVAAAFPMKAGVNDQTSYSAELEARYRDGLASLVAFLDTWLGPVDPTVVVAAPLPILGQFPPPTFLDSQRW